ncbi:Hypothetical predicted protein [Paramuricea clavata]|uniref:Uncharacterized protein n=1 Tax=Paramuricea clavata TaxID=317549 RepID=A0A6S7J3J1_PARCT|nr:Hypothetical predicted protein [Paramuricea clavata]
MKFKKLVEETQKSLESVSRSKHCLEISPSIKQPSTSRACTSTDGSLLSSNRRRNLDFTSLFSSDDDASQSNDDVDDPSKPTIPLHLKQFWKWLNKSCLKLLDEMTHQSFEKGRTRGCHKTTG